jgi:hypothetical protein
LDDDRRAAAGDCTPIGRLAPAGHLDQTLRRITAAAVEVLPEVEYASITVKHADGELETFAPTDDLLWGIDAAQYDLRKGPVTRPLDDSSGPGRDRR